MIGILLAAALVSMLVAPLVIMLVDAMNDDPRR